MELFLTIGNYKSISEMLDCIDAQEYDFLLEKFRNQAFGFSMVNFQLAQICFVIANLFSKNSTMKIEDLIYGEIGQLEATNQDNVSLRLMKEDYFRMYINQGLSKIEANEKATSEVKKYSENLKMQRIREKLIKEQSFDLSSPAEKGTEQNAFN